MDKNSFASFHLGSGNNNNNKKKESVKIQNFMYGHTFLQAYTKHMHMPTQLELKDKNLRN